MVSPRDLNLPDIDWKRHCSKKSRRLLEGIRDSFLMLELEELKRGNAELGLLFTSEAQLVGVDSQWQLDCIDHDMEELKILSKRDS